MSCVRIMSLLYQIWEGLVEVMQQVVSREARARRILDGSDANVSSRCQ